MKIKAQTAFQLLTVACFLLFTTASQADVIYDVVVEYEEDFTYSFAMRFADNEGVKHEGDLLDRETFIARDREMEMYAFTDQSFGKAGVPWIPLRDTARVGFSDRRITALGFLPSRNSLIFTIRRVFEENGDLVKATLSSSEMSLKYDDAERNVSNLAAVRVHVTLRR